jgi:hypothetical protein
MDLDLCSANDGTPKLRCFLPTLGLTKGGQIIQIALFFISILFAINSLIFTANPQPFCDSVDWFISQGYCLQSVGLIK